MFLAHRQFRLARRPDQAGLRCDADGVSLGGVQLLRKTDAGLAPRAALDIDVLTKAGYGAAFDAEKLRRGLAVASRALNDGDVVGVFRPTLSSEFEFDVGEILSPRQSGPEREQVLRPAVPSIRNFDASAYKLLLKLLRALGLA